MTGAADSCCAGRAEDPLSDSVVGAERRRLLADVILRAVPEMVELHNDWDNDQPWISLAVHGLEITVH